MPESHIFLSFLALDHAVGLGYVQKTATCTTDAQQNPDLGETMLRGAPQYPMVVRVTWRLSRFGCLVEAWLEWAFAFPSEVWQKALDHITGRTLT